MSNTQQYKDGPRRHFYLTQDYVKLIETHKDLNESYMHFIKKCIDFTIENMDSKNPITYRDVKKLISKLVDEIPDK